MRHISLTFPKLRNEEIRSFRLPAAQFGIITHNVLCKCQGLLVLEALAFIRREIQITQNLCEVFFKKVNENISLIPISNFLLTE